MEKSLFEIALVVVLSASFTNDSLCTGSSVLRACTLVSVAQRLLYLIPEEPSTLCLSGYRLILFTLTEFNVCSCYVTTVGNSKQFCLNVKYYIRNLCNSCLHAGVTLMSLIWVVKSPLSFA